MVELSCAIMNSLWRRQAPCQQCCAHIAEQHETHPHYTESHCCTSVLMLLLLLLLQVLAV
jgi:hypothetical protein